MYLTHLSLTDYRAFTRLDMDVPRRILLLVGKNAQGKTSILEAVYYLATFTSFHAANDRQLVNFMAGSESLAVGRLVADYCRGQAQHRIEVRLIQENGNGGARLRKEILIDGVRKTAQSAMGHFTAVIFLPQMMRIIEGAPEERRRYLNLALSQALPGYARDLSEYAQLLTQRNALLKQLSERSGDADQLVYWDELLAQRGAAIMHARIQAVREIEFSATRIHHRLTSAQEVLRLYYLPAYDPLAQLNGQYALPLAAQVDLAGLSQEQLYRGFRQRLEAIRQEEIARGMTTVGPHRDDLRIIANAVDLGYYGSRGQARTAILALKLAEVSWLQEKTGHWPVLLLDEIMAELDLQRRDDVLSALANCEQALLTTTDLHLFSSDFVKNNTVWQVTGGQVSAIPADF
ncbi:MAG: DNA replication/repair protein RecF [Anaerolineaceae bacterium]|jgi:DNA replication and repair protein RecF